MRIEMSEMHKNVMEWSIYPITRVKELSLPYLPSNDFLA